jgi:hypothetical protein
MLVCKVHGKIALKEVVIVITKPIICPLCLCGV